MVSYCLSYLLKDKEGENSAKHGTYPNAFFDISEPCVLYYHYQLKLYFIIKCRTDMGSITFKCNSLHDNYYQNHCITLHYNYRGFDNVIDDPVYVCTEYLVSRPRKL